jgi:hypothetical protein
LRLVPELAEPVDAELADITPLGVPQSSKRFIAVCRKTVAIWPSMLSATSASRAADRWSPRAAGRGHGLAEHRRRLGERQRVD